MYEGVTGVAVTRFLLVCVTSGDEKKPEAKTGGGASSFIPKLSNNPLSKLRNMLTSQDQGSSSSEPKQDGDDAAAAAAKETTTSDSTSQESDLK